VQALSAGGMDPGAHLNFGISDCTICALSDHCSIVTLFDSGGSLHGGDRAANLQYHMYLLPTIYAGLAMVRSCGDAQARSGLQ
jgi:hypothetical protein